MPHSLPSQHGYKQGKSRRAGNLTPSGPLLAVSRGAGSVDADHPRRCVHGRVGPEPPRPIGPPDRALDSRGPVPARQPRGGRRRRSSLPFSSLLIFSSRSPAPRSPCAAPLVVAALQASGRASTGEKPLKPLGPSDRAICRNRKQFGKMKHIF